jgi:hypothetical protein
MGLAWNSRSIARRYQCVAEDRFLCTLPWHHMNAIMMTGLVPLNAGACTEFVNLMRCPDPLEAVRKTKATVASLTPTLMSLLLEAEPGNDSLGDVRFAFSGAAPLGGVLWRAFEARFKIPVYQGYGLTETTCWAASTLPGVAHDYENVGYALDCGISLDRQQAGDVTMWLGSNVSSEGSRAAELLIGGPLLMSGYRYVDGRRTPSRTANGEFRTGDLGVIEKDGLVRVVGRLKEIIIRGGANIVPETIDAVLRTHPLIADCKTVGVSDEQFGERAVTACVAAAGAHPTRAELRQFLVSRLSNESIPDEIVLLARLPRTPVGKIALSDLRKLVSGESARSAFAAINRSKYKRAQPSDPERATRFFQLQLLGGEPLKFLTYWGVGKREEVAQVDFTALYWLREYIDSARTNPGVEVELDVLLADIHAYSNGKPAERVARYHGEIRRACDQVGFRCTSLSEIWQSAGLDFGAVQAEALTADVESLSTRMGISAPALEFLRDASL